MSTSRTKFVQTQLTLPAREALRRSALAYSARVGRRLSMSAIVLAALAVADQHPDELTDVLTSPQTGDHQ